MDASRFNRKSLERLLFTAAGMILLVILSVITFVIPQVASATTPDNGSGTSVLLFWVLFAIHVVILGSLVEKILVSIKGRQMRKAGLIIPGVLLILLSMFLIDTAGVIMENQPDLLVVAIILFFSACFDMVSGIITIMLPTRIPDNQQIISEQGQNCRK